MPPSRASPAAPRRPAPERNPVLSSSVGNDSPSVERAARRLALLNPRKPRPRSRAIEYLHLDDGGTMVRRLRPAELAEEWAAPLLTADAELFRSGGALLSRPRGSSAEPVPVSVLDTADRLRDVLRAPLPANTAGTLYADLHIYAAYGDPEVVRSYLADVVRAVRAAAPPYVDPNPTPEPPRPRRTGRSAEQRQADERERARTNRAEVRDGTQDDMRSAAGWMSVWRELATPGAHPATAVRRTYVEKVDAAGRTPVGRNMFYRVADEVCGPRKRRVSGPVYVVPQEVAPMNREQRKELASLIVDRLTAEWRTHALDGLADLLTDRQAEREPAAPVATPAATGHAHVVSLDSRRARRAA
jgi:hypothetical protein